MDQKESIISSKAYAFALQVISTYKILVSEKEYILSNQLLRCGTSIRANANEAIASETKRDFVHKLSISLKEARETSYWLRLLKDSGYLKEDNFSRLFELCSELIKILSSIILTTKKRYLEKP